MSSRLPKLLAVPVFCCATLLAQQSAPPIVAPGAPGQPSRTLPATTRPGPARQPSKADIDFMQGMIMHHGQAVEMTALIRTRSQNPAVQSLGHKISLSQTDEMKYMQRWLVSRGLPPGPGAPNHMDHVTTGPVAMDHSRMTPDQMANMDMSGTSSMPSMQPNTGMIMPGMLTPAQMTALAAATGPAFDHLFLAGMIQHHTGALTMVDQLFASPGAGQDADLFDFATDVDNTQRAEIDIMKSLLQKESK